MFNLHIEIKNGNWVHESKKCTYKTRVHLHLDLVICLTYISWLIKRPHTFLVLRCLNSFHFFIKYLYILFDLCKFEYSFKFLRNSIIQVLYCICMASNRTTPVMSSNIIPYILHSCSAALSPFMFFISDIKLVEL